MLMLLRIELAKGRNTSCMMSTGTRLGWKPLLEGQSLADASTVPWNKSLHARAPLNKERNIKVVSTSIGLEVHKADRAAFFQDFQNRLCKGTWPHKLDQLSDRALA